MGRTGRPGPFAGSWIAATVLHLGRPLVPYNPGDGRDIAALTGLAEASEALERWLRR